MVFRRRSTNGPTPFDDDAYDITQLPDGDNDFTDDEGIEAFARALSVPESPSNSDLTQLDHSQRTQFITALNDWKPIRQRARKEALRRKKRRPPRRGKDETREGFVYTILKWPLFAIVMTWIIFLGAAYLLTRFYVYSYEHYVSMRGKREQLRRRVQKAVSYDEWVYAAKQMDKYLGNERWKEEDDYAYYNSTTIKTVRDSLKCLRTALERQRSTSDSQDEKTTVLEEELRTLLEGSVKNNFVGTENSRMYSESYYGTKNLVQSYVDEVELSLAAISDSSFTTSLDKGNLFKHLYANYGRTALCLSGGGTFAYYHFGVAKALLDAGVLPEVITGTSGGALVAALLATRTDDELKKLLVPALAHRIKACGSEIMTFARLRRWWSTGAHFDSIEWAKRCSWFCRGSLTFREAYERTGRILNVTCIPSDPHSPAVLANYLTSPDCIIWSAVLASAAVPGILNPVVLMKKTRTGRIVPFSFGHRWKDGSLRTDIPLKSLNTHFNVTFSIVSQVNPHINLFFFSSRGTVGRPVTHRRGRGWRGGFLGSATEQYLKLDLTKWLKVLRHLELLPRYLGQDWSEIWLQRFSGTITIWPKSKASDFLYILSDPPPARLARMIHAGQQSCFPKLKFVANRMKIERLVEAGVRKYADEVVRPTTMLGASGDSDAEADAEGEIDEAAVPVPDVLSEVDLQSLLRTAREHSGTVSTRPAAGSRSRSGKSPRGNTPALTPSPDTGAAASGSNLTAGTGPAAQTNGDATTSPQDRSPSITKRWSGWWSGPSTPSAVRSDAGDAEADAIRPVNSRTQSSGNTRRSSVISELQRQSSIFFDDEEDTEADGSAEGEMSAEGSAAEDSTGDGQ